MLPARIDGLLDQFAGRILPLDTPAARHYAELAATARRAGKGFPIPDGYIAAIAAAHGFAVASPDTSAFAAAGLTVIAPWTAALWRGSMTKVKVAGFGVSLDGFAAGPDQSLENPLGVNGPDIFQRFFPTNTFRQIQGCMA